MGPNIVCVLEIHCTTQLTLDEIFGSHNREQFANMCKIIKHTEVQQYICICNQILCVCVLETLLSTQLNIVAVFGPHVIVKLYPKMCKIAKHSEPIYTEN